MTAQLVRFSIAQDSVEQTFDRSSLKVGRKLYVTRTSTSPPYSVSAQGSADAVEHWVAWISTSSWYVRLEPRFVVREDFVTRTAEAVERFSDRFTVAKALSKFGSRIRPEHQHKTSEFERNPLSIVYTVLERLDIVARISLNWPDRPAFVAKEPLLSYLLLTCFDRLGQPAEWLDFTSWIKTDAARKLLEDSPENLEGLELVEGLLQTYHHLYGVKHSFLKFIKSLPADTLRNLLDSIEIITHTLPPETRRLPPASDDERIAYLLKRRNDYTHKADFHPPAGEWYRGSYTNHLQTFSATKWTDTSTLNWPEVLEETVRIGLAKFLEAAAADA